MTFYAGEFYRLVVKGKFDCHMRPKHFAWRYAFDYPPSSPAQFFVNRKKQLLPSARTRARLDSTWTTLQLESLINVLPHMWQRRRQRKTRFTEISDFGIGDLIN
jgi:hypothetical protein